MREKSRLMENLPAETSIPSAAAVPAETSIPSAAAVPAETSLRETLWEVEGLQCVLGGKTILQNVSFSLRKGEFTVLLGANGAGKSTLLKCLMRLCPIHSAVKIEQEGRNLLQLSPRELARKTAYVPQVQEQQFPFTVKRFIEAARYAHQTAWGVLTASDSSFCTQILEETGLRDFALREISTLSGGELQRVWLAGAFAQNTDTLFLDEAVSQMDYRAKEEVLALLRRWNRVHGKTILAVTHDINEAVRNASRIIALKKGEIIFDGPTSDFLTEEILFAVYQTKFLLIDSPKLPFPAVLPAPSSDE